MIGADCRNGEYPVKASFRVFPFDDPIRASPTKTTDRTVHSARMTMLLASSTRRQDDASVAVAGFLSAFDTKSIFLPERNIF